MIEFLAGAIAAGHLVAGTFFLRYWKKTSESLFAYFSAAFFTLGIERVIWALAGDVGDFQPLVYVPRLFAFSLIIFGILAKNRDTSPR